MTKIIFLDIDGPMIPMRAYYLPKQTKIVSVFDPCAVGLLNRLLQFSGAKIVISSTWGTQGRKVCADLLRKNKISPTHLHKDWITPRKMSSARHHEINWWLRDHPDVVDYVALEDEDLHVDLVPKAVQCDTYEGFSWRNYLECCVHLNAYEHPEPDSRDKFQAQVQYFKKREIARTFRRTESGAHKLNAAIEILFPEFPEED